MSFKETVRAVGFGIGMLTASMPAGAKEPREHQPHAENPDDLATRINSLLSLIKLAAVKLISDDTEVDAATKLAIQNRLLPRAAVYTSSVSSPAQVRDITMESVFACISGVGQSTEVRDVALCLLDENSPESASTSHESLRVPALQEEVLTQVLAMLRGRLSPAAVALSFEAAKQAQKPADEKKTPETGKHPDKPSFDIKLEVDINAPDA